MHDTGCLGLVHWDDPERWYREGGGRRVQDGFYHPDQREDTIDGRKSAHFFFIRIDVLEQVVIDVLVIIVQ